MKKIVFAFIVSLLAAHVNAQIVIDSKFKARTYEEMIAPLQMAQRFHEECLANLEVLAEQTEQIEPLISKSKDPSSWKMYVDCYNSIINVYNSILKNGTNQNTRNVISNLKKDSSSVRSKIRSAYERRNQMANEQYARLRSMEGLTCDRFYSDMSLDEFLNGNTPSVKYNYSQSALRLP